MLGLGRHHGSARAPVYADGDAGYGIVWQDTEGAWLSASTTGPRHRLDAVLRSPSATDFGGADLQPPIVGLAPFGTDFGVLLARPPRAELWRIDQVGNRRAGAPHVPVARGRPRDRLGAAAVTGEGLP